MENSLFNNVTKLDMAEDSMRFWDSSDSEDKENYSLVKPQQPMIVHSKRSMTRTSTVKTLPKYSDISLADFGPDFSDIREITNRTFCTRNMDKPYAESLQQSRRRKCYMDTSDSDDKMEDRKITGIGYYNLKLFEFGLQNFC